MSRRVITLPAKFREALGLKADDQLIAETTSEGLLLRPAVTLPVEIYSEDRIREFDTTESDLAELLPRATGPFDNCSTSCATAGTHMNGKSWPAAAPHPARGCR